MKNLRVVAAFACSTATIVSHGLTQVNGEALRADKYRGTDAGPQILPHPLDPQNCYPLPQLHIKNPNPKLLDEFYEFERWFVDRHDRDTAVDTLTQDRMADLIETLPEGNFIYWGSNRGVHEMSAYNSNTVVLHESKLDAVIWRYDQPSNHADVEIQRGIKLEGDHVAFISNNMGVFAHFIADHLGYWAYLREVMPQETRFIFVDFRRQNQALLEQLDPEFASRVDWIQCESMRHCATAVSIRNGNLMVVKPTVSTRHLGLYHLAREWVLKVLPPKPETLQDKTVVYYTRNSQNAFHERAMEIKQEAAMLDMIQKSLEKYNRPERLVVFSGTETFLEQIELFRSATTIIGTHGGGLANLFWTLPGKSCDTRPKVLEFLIDPETTPEVQAGGFGKTYFKLFSTCSWVEYHHVFFTPPSNHQVTYIDLEDFGLALDAIFDKSTPSNTVAEPPAASTNAAQ